MSRNPPQAETDLHRTYARFVRSLARRLVSGDENAADDVEQGTWLAACAHPPARATSMRGWLASVARSVARQSRRSERRRAHRERAVAPREETPSTLDTLQRLETLRDLVDAIHELSERNQEVLLLRYYEDLPPREIARRLGLSIDAAKARLKRALAELRLRLDQRHGGDRRTWCLGLLSMIGAGGPIGGGGVGSGMLGKGVVVMSVKAKLGAAAGVLLACLLLVWLILPQGPQPPEPERTPAPVVAGPVAAAPEAAVEGEVSPSKSPAIVEATDNEADSLPFARATLHGRVVDDMRRPVGGIEVTLLFPPHPPYEGVTGPDGRFVIEGVLRAESRHLDGSAVAIDRAEQRIAVQYATLASRAWREAPPFMVSPRDPDRLQDLGTLVLGPAHPLEVLVRAGEAPVAGARVRVDSGIDRLACGVARTGDDGTARFLLPDGIAVACAELPPLAGRASTTLPTGVPASTVIDLAPTYSLDVRVVETESGLPVEGATIQVLEQARPGSFWGRSPYLSQGAPGVRVFDAAVTPTDASGRTRIDGLPRDAMLAVTARKRNYTSTRDRLGLYPAVVEVRDTDSEVLLELAPMSRRTIRIPVVPGELPVPPDGTPLRIVEVPGWCPRAIDMPQQARIEENSVVIEGAPWHDWGAYAVTPEGAIAHVGAKEGEEVGEETSFRQPRSIEATVRDEGGDPVQGARISAQNQGNNLIASGGETDENGYAKLDGLYGNLTEVSVSTPSGLYRQHMATVDLATGNASLEVVLPAVKRIPLQFFIDGTPRLPAEFHVWRQESRARVVEEDPDAGICEVEMLVAPGEREVSLAVRASGFVGSALTVPVDRLGRDEPIRIDLPRAWNVIARIERPEGARIDIHIQEWNEEVLTWVEMAQPSFAYPNGPDGTFEFRNLRPGRYRLQDQVSFISSQPIVLEEGGGEFQVTLDLGMTRRITGRVEAPPGTDLSLVRVLVEGDDLEAAAQASPASTEEAPGMRIGARLDRSNRFEVRVPIDRIVTLRPWHPILAPAADGGSVAIRNGTPGEVVLRLAPGPEIVLALPEEFPASVERLPGTPSRGLRVLLFEGDDVSLTPAADLVAPIGGGEARCGGFLPGRYTIWIDPIQTYAPILLRDVELGEGVTHLELPPVDRGSSIRALIRVPAGQVPPRVWVCGLRESGPVYSRSIVSNGEAEVVVPGFGAGTFKVGVVPQSADHGSQAFTLTLDGRNDRTIELDLR